jgi:hypothetical protein
METGSADAVIEGRVGELGTCLERLVVDLRAAGVDAGPAVS